MSAAAERLGGLWAALRQGVWLAAVVVAIAALAQGFAPLSLKGTVTYALVLLLIVLALYVFSGLTGILSFGHVGFVAIGAYVGALLTITPALKRSLFAAMPGFLHWVLDTQAGFVVAALAAGAVAALLGALFAIALARLDGMAASISTLALLAIVHTVLLEWDEVTRGSSSVIGVPRDTTITTAAAVACVALIAVSLLQGSRLGLRLKAARADAIAARACGLNVVRDRRVALILSAFLAGVAGSLFAQFNTTFSPNTFYLDLTFTTVAMLILGGMRSLVGAFVGVAVVTVVTEVMQRIQDGGLGPLHGLPAGAPQLVLALLLIAVLIVRPEGIAGRPLAASPARLRGRFARHGGR